MTKENQLLGKLEERLAAARARQKRAPADLHVIESDSAQTDREWHLRMITHLSRRWGLQLLVDQATRGYLGLHSLPDDSLACLHRDLHRAYECLREGVDLVDAGLLQPPPEL